MTLGGTGKSLAKSFPGLGLVPYDRFHRKEVLGMAATYRVAVIGTGGIARWHAHYFVKIEGAELVAACDISPERLQKFGEEYGLTARTTLPEPRA